MEPIKESQITSTLHIFQCGNIEIVIVRISVLTIGICLNRYILYKITNMAKNILAKKAPVDSTKLSDIIAYYTIRIKNSLINLKHLTLLHFFS